MLLNEHEKPTKVHYKIFGFSWAGWVFDFYDLVLFTFLLIPIVAEFNVSNYMISYVLGASLGATAIGGILFGTLSDIFGRKTVLQWTIILYSLGTVLCGLAPDLWSLIMFRIITGIGVGGEWATGQTLVNETFPSKMRGKFGSFLETGTSTGIILASIVGGFLAPEIGWRVCFFLSALPALLVILIRKEMPESDLWLKRKNNQLSTGIPSVKKVTGKFKILISKDYLHIFVISIILAVLVMSAYWFTFSWLPDYLYEERHLELVKSAIWLIITQVGAFLGCLSFGVVSDKWGRRPAFTIYSFLMATGLIMVTVMWNIIVSFPIAIFGFMFLLGFGTGTFGGFGSLYSEIFPTEIRNTAMSASFNLARGVQFFTPLVIAILGKSYGLSSGIFLGAIFAVFAGLWIWKFPETRGRDLDDVQDHENKQFKGDSDGTVTDMEPVTESKL
jgi:MFS family permease